MRIFFVFSSIFVAASASAIPKNLCSSEDNHTLIKGTCDNELESVYFHTLLVEATKLPYPEVNERELLIPDSGAFAKNIKCIQIKDLVANRKGGCPFIIDGGVDNYYGLLRFISQKGEDMKFTIQAFVCSGNNC